MSILLRLFFWIAEGAGGIFTARGRTEPNTGLPLILLAACYWPWRGGQRRRAHCAGLCSLY